MPVLGAYNPFFDDFDNTKIEHKSQETQNFTPEKKIYQFLYFGYIETQKGKFALISIDSKSFVVKEGDTLYTAQDEINVFKLTSNVLVIKDKNQRAQSIYFSKREEEGQL